MGVLVVWVSLASLSSSSADGSVVARKKASCNLISFHFVIPHDTIPSTGEFI
jgi:hypothetical protein